MIRINLLGVPKKTTRGGRRASTVAATGGGRRIQHRYSRPDFCGRAEWC